MTPLLGITGGTGVGKSTVAHALARRGARILDADAIGHEVLGQQETIRALAERFGASVLNADGSIDRRALGTKAFASPEALASLNAVVHPPLLRLLRQRLDEARQNPDLPLVAVDAALITEWGIEDWFDRVAVVTASTETVRERLRSKGLTVEQIDRRIASQLPEEKRIARADIVIQNDGSTADVEAKVDALWREMTGG